MKFSFIIASLKDRGEYLQECINSIELASEYKKNCDLEILVVFQGAQWDKNKFKVRYPQSISFYTINEKGLSKARNFAIKKSKGDFLVFLDDDARLKEDFIQVLVENISPGLTGAYCGTILEEKSRTRLTPYSKYNTKKRLGANDFRYFMGSSHILERSTIDKIGYYDEKFGAGAKYPGAEESDIFFRMKRNGIKIIYIPGLMIYHPLVFGPKVFEYSYATGAMLAKQTFSDKKRLFTYLFIISVIISGSVLRIIQNSFFPMKKDFKDKKMHHKSILAGILKGFFRYATEQATGNA